MVIPSLPGFWFSGPLDDGGWTYDRIAGAFIELMTRLGCERFGVQGGDVARSWLRWSGGGRRSGLSVCT